MNAGDVVKKANPWPHRVLVVGVVAAVLPFLWAAAVALALFIRRQRRQEAPQQRTVVVLRVWDGLSYAEIAELVGKQEATVRSHMHHGLAALRKYLEPRLQERD